MDDIAKTYPELPPEILDFIEALQQQNSVLKADLARKDESGQQAVYAAMNKAALED